MVRGQVAPLVLVADELAADFLDGCGEGGRAAVGGGEDDAAGVDETLELGEVGVGEVGIAGAGDEEDGSVEPLVGIDLEVDGLPVDGAFELLGHPAGDVGVVARAGVPGAVVFELVEDDGVAATGEEEEGVGGADDARALVLPRSVILLVLEEEEAPSWYQFVWLKNLRPEARPTRSTPYM